MKVYALIGPSGTGKSYRAPYLAQKYKIDCIIDDGLLISEGRIIAGRSAKGEVNKIRATKIALFYFSRDREAVKEALGELAPQRIMVLGVSLSMVEKICEHLELPLPEEVLDIEKVASPREIELALSARENEGKHTIPVPLVELKRNLWNNLMDAVPVTIWKWFYSSREKTVVRPPFSYLGKLVISEKALFSLLYYLLSHLSWIDTIKGLSIHSTNRGIEIVIDCILRPGFSVSRVGRLTQKRVKEGLEHLTGVEVRAVHINVEGVAERKEEVAYV
ncbi:MAG: hypothetical protein PWP57_588 [Candidatus Atribacteria bacterium]|nr:hypothetical protein [Candidatus Atribacteria bacterium]